MRTVEVEAWVLSLVDRIGAGQHVEDSRVELKADWPEASKPADLLGTQTLPTARRSYEKLFLGRLVE